MRPEPVRAGQKRQTGVAQANGLEHNTGKDSFASDGRCGLKHLEKTAMNNLEKLVSLGAECVGGELIMNRKSLGLLRDGSFTPNEYGLAILQADITDVEVKTETKRKKTKPAEAEKVVVVEADVPLPADDDEFLESLDLNGAV